MLGRPGKAAQLYHDNWYEANHSQCTRQMEPMPVKIIKNLCMPIKMTIEKDHADRHR